MKRASTFIQVLMIIFLCLLGEKVNAQAHSEFSHVEHIQVLSLSAYYPQSGDELSVNQVTSIPPRQWQAFDSNHKKLRLKPGVNWFALKLFNVSLKSDLVYIELGNRFQVANAKLYTFDNHQALTSLPLKLNSVNSWQAPRFIEKESTVKLFIRVESDTTQKLTLNINSPEQFIEKQTSKHYQYGFSVGGSAFIALIFLLLSLATRDKTLAVLSAYFVCRTFMLSGLLGTSLFYLYPEYQELRGFELPILGSLSSVFYLLFACSLFQMHLCAPKLNKAIKIVSLVLLCFIPLSLILSVNANVIMTSVTMTFAMILLAGIGLYLHQLKQRLALLFTSAMVVQCVFTFAILLGFYFEFTVFEDRESLHIASFTINVLLIVFIICRQYYYQLQDKQAIQKEALSNAVASKSAQAQLLKLQTDNQEELEQRVQERTLELNIALNELEEVNRELEQKNTIDELTTLYNRRFYDQKILAEYRRSKRNLTSLSLVIIDIDHFKTVNDTYGHLAGDQCLSWLAQHIKQSLKRSTDLGCRYGGEEFCLILPDTDTNGAIALAQGLKETVESFDFIYRNQHIPLTISCGISTYQQQKNAFPEHIFLAADKALYRAKHAGRNQVAMGEITQELILQEPNND